jgi:hypothetical protein
MEQKALADLTDQELLAEAKKMKWASIQYAFIIGFLIGIVVFSVAKNSVGWFTLIPLYFAYRLVKNPDYKWAELKQVMRARNLK